MLVIPRATEKTYAEQAKRTYVFNVPEGGSKQARVKLPAFQRVNTLIQAQHSAAIRNSLT